MSKLDEDISHGHYLIHPNGTVTDTRNGLMWKRCAEGKTWDGKTCVGKANTMSWDQTMNVIVEDRGFLGFGKKERIEQKSWPVFAGYSDWRMPTIEELRTLVHCSSGNQQYWNETSKEKFRCGGNYERPTIDKVVFYNTGSTWFWSASAYAFGSINAWGLDFKYGNGYWDDKSDAGQVRLVRVGRAQ
ncbi:hypothetical protein TI04_07925 [Achromatium sp. WMS2]|nr:hypothetical protein TI04_07925 [Achromatium sp. WMS2]